MKFAHLLSVMLPFCFNTAWKKLVAYYNFAHFLLCTKHYSKYTKKLLKKSF